MKREDLLEYNGYYGSVEYSAEDRLLTGKILFINDLVMYMSPTATDIEEKFRSAVDLYLENCARLNQKPEKPFSGTFNVRIGQELHRKAAIKAERNGQSLNEFVKDAIGKSLGEELATKRKNPRHAAAGSKDGKRKASTPRKAA